MTPEDFARLAVPCFGPPHCTGNDHDYECDRRDPERFNRAVEQISAALRERDAAWRKALDDSHYGSGHRWRPAEWELCPACAPLRALLEDAGK